MQRHLPTRPGPDGTALARPRARGLARSRAFALAQALARPRALARALALAVGLAAFATDSRPLSAQAPSTPAPPPGVTLACGGGSLPDELLARFVARGGGTTGRLVLIPTASASADDPAANAAAVARWRERGFGHVTTLHTRLRADAERDGFAAPLGDATAVWIGGGDQSRVTTVYGGTPVEAALQRLLTRGGIVGGTSAGAACQTKVMIAGGRDTPTLATGLDLIRSVVVDQHFRERERLPRLRAAIAAHRDHVGLGVDEGTGVWCEGATFEVVGKGAMTVVVADTPPRVARTGTVLDATLLRDEAREAAMPAPALAPIAGTLWLCATEPPPAAREEFAARARRARVVRGTDGTLRLDTVGTADTADADAVLWLADDTSNERGLRTLGVRLRERLRAGAVVIVCGESALRCVDVALRSRDDAELRPPGRRRGLALAPGIVLSLHAAADLDAPDTVPPDTLGVHLAPGAAVRLHGTGAAASGTVTLRRPGAPAVRATATFETRSPR